MKCPYCKATLRYDEEDVLNIPKGTIPIFICPDCAGISAIQNGRFRFLTKKERELLRNGKGPESLKREHDKIVSRLIG
jgi:hypothetical protein